MMFWVLSTRAVDSDRRKHNVGYRMNIDMNQNTLAHSKKNVTGGGKVARHEITDYREKISGQQIEH